MAEVVRDPKSDQSDYGKAYRITSMVVFAQLDHEIAVAHGWDHAGLVATGVLESASKDSPVTLYVTHPESVEATVLTVIAAHRPNPKYSPPGQEFDDEAFQAVVEKAQQGCLLDDSEVQIALRGLLRPPTT